MKTLRWLLVFALAVPVMAQNVRWDLPVYTTQASGGNLLPVYAVPGALVSFYSCSGVNCTVLANTYNSASSGTPCPTGMQVVLQNSSTCVANADPDGNMGAWFLPGQYMATITANGVTYDHFFTVSAVGAGGTTYPLTAAVSGGAAPNSTFDGTAAQTFDYHSFGAQQVLTLTTTGTSGPSTLSSGTLNIPQYTSAAVSVNGSVVSNPNFNGTTPAAGTNGINIAFQVSASNVSGQLVGDGNSSHYLDGTGGFSTPAGDGMTANPMTAAASGGAAPGTTFDGSLARTFDYHSFGAQQALTLTTTGTGGSSTLSSGALNIPQYQTAITLTTTGTGGAATLTGGALNIPNYMPLYDISGAEQTNPHMVNGSGALTGGTLAVTLTGSAVFTSSTSYVCNPDDSTGINGIEVTYTDGSHFTLTGTGTDSVRYTCVGN